MAAAGRREEIELLAGPATQVIGLGGRCVYPGLIDAHMHFEQYALSLEKVDCETATREECLLRVRARASQTPAGMWILGHGWNQNSWDRYGTAPELDAAAPNNPVYLTAKSLHAGWANTEALRRAGIHASTADPPRGIIGRMPAGEPSGVVFEEAMALIAAQIAHPTAEHVQEAIDGAQAHLWRLGLTGIHDFDGPRAFRAIQALWDQRRLGIRVVKHIRREEAEQALGLGLQTGFGDEWLRTGNLKLFADGALGPRTAAMLEAYEGEPGNTGLLARTAEELAEIGLAAARSGLALAIHAIGDRANREALTALERIRSQEPSGGRLRHRIEHMQLLHPDDMRRAAASGVIASMQPIHATSDMAMAEKHWGARCRTAYAWRSLLDAGTLIAFGSDAPVEPPNPFLGLHAALTRQRADGEPGGEGWIPSQRISLTEALTAYTRAPAYACGMEGSLGTLEPGRLADLFVLDQDLFSLSPDEIAVVRPAGTMVGGDWRFREF
ncbi:MAG TPA: amidohydrolase [Anaerolineales bacterium]|nr:amidohydrolase [Anaerolineales bacterium]